MNLQAHRQSLIRACHMKLRDRVMAHAFENRDRDVWRKRLLALCYGAGFQKVSQIKEKSA